MIHLFFPRVFSGGDSDGTDSKWRERRFFEWAYHKSFLNFKHHRCLAQREQTEGCWRYEKCLALFLYLDEDGSCDLRGVITVHMEAGCDGAPQSSQESEERAAKM